MSLLPIAYDIALRAHAGQSDKLGVPYIKHVEAVAEGLAPFGNDELTAAGWLHDTLEDSDMTADGLLDVGLTQNVVDMVVQVTNRRGVAYLDKIESIGHPGAILVKIADNAHNSRIDRLSRLDEDTYVRLSEKYRAARKILWPKAGKDAVGKIIRIVNPDLEHTVTCDNCWNRLECG